MQLKPINTKTSHLQYHWFPPHPQNRKPRQEGRRQTWLPLNGAKMVRRPAPEGGDEQACPQPIKSAPAPRREVFL